jgi:hypothetical protein
VGCTLGRIGQVTLSCLGHCQHYYDSVHASGGLFVPDPQPVSSLNRKAEPDVGRGEYPAPLLAPERHNPGSRHPPIHVFKPDPPIRIFPPWAGPMFREMCSSRCSGVT